MQAVEIALFLIFAEGFIGWKAVFNGFRPN